MKKTILLLVLSLGMIINGFAQVAINETGAEADSSAILDLSSTNKGFLVPRITTAQRNAISTDQSALMVYDTDTESFWFWDNSQTSWIEIKAGSALDINSLADGSSDGSSIFLGDSAGVSDDGNNNNNIALGIKALKKNNHGVNIVAIGNAAMEQANNANNVVAIGDSTLYYSGFQIPGYLYGCYNTAVGSKSMRHNGHGNSNTAIGASSLYSNLSGNSNTACGRESLYSNKSGNSNTAIGTNSLYSNTIGSGNTATGFYSLHSNTIGSNNTANGLYALYSNESGSNNTAIGFYSLNSNTTGDYNIAIGYNSLFSNTTANENTAVGYYALHSDTTGSYNVALGSYSLYDFKNGMYNTVTGYKAMCYADSTNFNVAMGAYSLYKTKQSNLVAIGYAALYNNGYGATNSVHATANTAVGSNSLHDNTTGYRNTALGYESLKDNTTAEDNTAIGYFSLHNNTSGGKNVAIGSNSMDHNTTGLWNTSIGTLSARNNGSGSYNTNIGYLANAYNVSGSNNTAIGMQAGMGVSGNSISGCVFLGYQAGKNNTNSNKLFIDNSSTSTPLIGGDFSTNQVDINGTVKITGGTPGDGKVLTSDASGLATWEPLAVYASEINELNDAYNVGTKMFMGTNAGLNNTGGYNIGVGYESLKLNTTGTHNTAFGFKTLDANTEGIGNTGLGLGALGANTTGDFNTAVGRESLDGNATGNYNTAVGYNAFPSGNYSNSVAIGYNTTVSGNNQVHIGNTSITEIKGQVPFTTYSDGRIKENIQEDVKGLDFILKLRPVTYTINLDKENRLLGMKDNTDFPRKYDIEKIKRTGFIAQEVETAAKSSNYDFSGVQKPKNDKDLYGLSYAEFVVPLVKSVQELNQKLEKENQMLKNRLEQLEKAILELQQNK